MVGPAAMAGKSTSAGICSSGMAELSVESGMVAKGLTLCASAGSSADNPSQHLVLCRAGRRWRAVSMVGV